VDNIKRMFGVTAAMITPFDENDNLDVAGIKRLVNFLIEKGVNCLYPTGTTGEAFKLSVAERKLVAETVIGEVDARVPVFVHVGASNINDVMELAMHAYECGADGVGVMTPTFFKVDEREMLAYYMEICRALPDVLPIYMYNIPQLSANDLKPNTIKEVLSSCKNIRGIKYSYPDILRIQEYLGIGDGFSVLAGADAMALAALCLGCDGIVSGVASVYPEPYVEIYRAYSRGEMVKAREFQRMANRYSHALKNGSNTGYFKAALNYRGIDVGHVRKPNLDITEFEKKELLKKLETLDAEFQKMINRDK